MAHYLLVYDRTEGRLLREQNYDNRADALRARFKAEREYSDRHSDVEVVVLSARSHGDLLKTHARYFLSLGELAGRMA